MKALLQILKKRNTVVFFDLEGTGVSHEIIEIGAFKVNLREDGTIKKVFKPFHCYVLPKHHVGSHVVTLTGITEEFLAKNGVPFRVMQKNFAKYVGKEYKGSLFVCYGDQDPQMFLASAENNMDASMEEAKFVSHHCFDFLRFFSRFITSDRGDPISLTKACELFQVKSNGKAHTAISDAYCLMKLYEAFLTNTALVASEYRKTLYRGKNLPDPFKILLERLQNGDKIDENEFDRIIEESLK